MRFCSIPLAAMLLASASMVASLCGVLRALRGDFFSLLRGMKTASPLAADAAVSGALPAFEAAPTSGGTGMAITSSTVFGFRLRNGVHRQRRSLRLPCCPSHGSDPFSVNAGGMSPTCLPEARERAAERGAAAGEHGRAARRAGRIGWDRSVTAAGRPESARPCRAQAAVAGERWLRPSLPHRGYGVGDVRRMCRATLRRERAKALIAWRRPASSRASHFERSGRGSRSLATGVPQTKPQTNSFF